MASILTTSDIIVSIRTSNPNYKVISTYSPVHGRSSSFYINPLAFTAWMDQAATDHSRFIDVDGNHTLVAHYMADDSVNIRILWTKVTTSNIISGYAQDFSVSCEKLRHALSFDIDMVKFLTSTERSWPQAKISFSPDAHVLIGELIRNKRTRRALSKAMSRNFIYGPGSSVSLYASWNSSFDFVSQGICGGLVLHSSSVRGKDGQKHEMVYFSVHT